MDQSYSQNFTGTIGTPGFYASLLKQSVTLFRKVAKKKRIKPLPKCQNRNSY